MKCLMSLLFILVLLVEPAGAMDSRLAFTTNNWAPYAAERLHGGGLTAAIVTEACKRVGLKVDFHFMPWNRSMDAVKQGQYDAIYNAYYSAERAKNYAMSKPYFQTQLVLCSKANTNIEYDGTTQSLHKYRIGVVRGFVNTDAIDSDADITKDTADNDILNLRKLLHDRVDLIIIDKYQAIHLIKNNPTIEADIRDIHFISPSLESKKLHVLFSKNKPGWKSNLHLFNQGLDEIKKDGTLNDIMAAYGFSVPHN